MSQNRSERDSEARIDELEKKLAAQEEEKRQLQQQINNATEEQKLNARARELEGTGMTKKMARFAASLNFAGPTATAKKMTEKVRGAFQNLRKH